jgi:hypothetical protein
VTAALTGAVAALTASAAAAPPTPAPVDDDYNFLQLAVLAEGVAIELYSATLESDDWNGNQRRALRALRRTDRRQERLLTAALGTEAPAEGDFEFVIPRRSLSSKARVLALARNLERLSVSVYTAGAQLGQDPGTRLLLAKLLGQDVQHLSMIAMLRGAGPITALPGAIPPERAATRIDRFLTVPTAPEIPADAPTPETTP